MINCDAWLKSVWHGVFMQKDKRAKFIDRWKLIAEPSITRSMTYEFESGGLQDLSQDPDYATAKNSFRRDPKAEEQSISDDQFLASKADDLSMVLTLYLDELSQWKNCLMFNGNYVIQSQIKTVQEK